MKRWYVLDEKISQVEQILIATLLAIMILLAFAQIVLRNFFATGFSWGDSLVRYLVVWVGFVGAAIATKEGKHITIEVISRWVSGAGRKVILAISHFSSAAICGLLTWAGIKFIWFEAQMGGTAFYKIPVWIPELIIPITFGLMTLRYTLCLVTDFVTSTARANKTECG